MPTPLDGHFEYNGAALYFTSSGVRRSVTMGNDTRVTDLTVADAVTETTIHTSPIAANEGKAGKMYILTLCGKVSTANASDFLTMRFKMGGDTIFSVVLDPKALTDEPWDIELKITIRTIGAGGTYSANIEGHINDQIVLETPINGSADTTIAEDLTSTVEWSSADTGNSLTVMQSVLEIIN